METNRYFAAVTDGMCSRTDKIRVQELNAFSVTLRGHIVSSDLLLRFWGSEKYSLCSYDGIIMFCVLS